MNSDSEEDKKINATEDLEEISNDDPLVGELIQAYPEMEDLIKRDPKKLHVIVTRLQSIRRTTFSGPMPPPALCEHYEKIHPGFTGKLMDRMDDQLKVRKDLVVTAQTHAFTEADNGRKSAVFIVSAVLVAIVFLAMFDKTEVALALSAVIVALAIAFLLGKKNKMPPILGSGKGKDDDKEE